MNFASIIPVFKSQKLKKDLIDDSGHIENDDLYKDWDEIDLNKVKKEIYYSIELRNDPELLDYLEKSLIEENVFKSVNVHN